MTVVVVVRASNAVCLFEVGVFLEVKLLWEVESEPRCEEGVEEAVCEAEGEEVAWIAEAVRD